jgi:hypothetical protein
VSYFGAACATEKALHKSSVREERRIARTTRFRFMA